MKKMYLLISCGLLCPVLSWAQAIYPDGRPSAVKRVVCIDQGIVMTHGNGPDSCDIYGAREAIVNQSDGKYFLFYDGAGKDGWRACLAESRNLITWEKKGAILPLGNAGQSDAKSASSPWVIKSGEYWHMFYLGTPNTSPAPDRVPAFPYLTMKAKAKKLEGPWIKQYELQPFPKNDQSFYTITSSPGVIVKQGNEYLQFFSGAKDENGKTLRTLGLARTKNLDSMWKIDEKPIFPSSEQVENSSLYYDRRQKLWYLFTNHIGLTEKNGEYTDAIWVYWTKDLTQWDTQNKAIVLDKQNCTWAKGAIGMPTVIMVGSRLALLYDGVKGQSTSHMRRDIGLAWIRLPIQIN